MRPQQITPANPASTEMGKPMRRHYAKHEEASCERESASMAWQNGKVNLSRDHHDDSPTNRRVHLENRVRIESVRANNPIEQVVARYIELRPSGRRLVGHCPFHDDPTPSFVVYINTQSWFCFGCDTGGDVFKFVELIAKTSFREVLEKLGAGTIAARPMVRAPLMPFDLVSSMEIANDKSSRLENRYAPSVEQRDDLAQENYALLTAATEAYHAAIFTQASVLEYLARRRIDLNMIRRHRIGYASGNDLERYLRFRGWDPEIAQDLGLVGPRGEYFRQRIIIPELRDGKAIYLVGRATQKYQQAKYLGLPGTPKPLYGIESIRGADDILVVEGAMDWLTLIEWGYPTVALLGSHLRSDLVGELATAKRIFIVTDSDEPGRRAAWRLAETFDEHARIVPPLPNAKDVNELATCPRCRETFSALVQQAR